MRQLRNGAVMTAVILALGAVAAPVAQQPEGEPFTTAIRKIKDGMYVIPGYDGQVTGGNVGVRVTSEGVILVDTNKPENIAAVIEKVKSVTPLPIKFAFGTHSHGDHSGGNPEVAKTAVLISHRNMRNEMIKGKLPSPPTVVFDREISIFLGGAEARAYHFADPAHTTGDTVVLFPDMRVVQLGDLLNWG
jgi:cyclase